LPYVLGRVWRSLFSPTFWVYFLRSVHILRWAMLAIVYLLMPFDLIPESVMGIIGYVDDILFALFLISFFLSIAAIQYYRNHH
jgi:RING finger protein 170